MLTKLPAIYERISVARLAKKTPNQVRKWRNPFIRAVKEFVEVCGDMPILDIEPTHARQLRGQFRAEAAAGDILAATANKSLGFLRTMIRAYCDEHGKTDPKPFEGMRVEGGARGPKTVPEFSQEWIDLVLYTPGPLAGMGQEARDILTIMESTGCRPSEIFSADASSIFLDAEIPHIRVETVGRDIKNDASHRSAPLIGQALDAMRRHPGGFPRYRDKDTFSAAANKFLRTNALMPSDDHVVYSLRHSFEGRMKRAGIDVADRAAMMGHSRKQKTGREKYGDDATLAEKVEILRKAGFPGA